MPRIVTAALVLFSFAASCLAAPASNILEQDGFRLLPIQLQEVQPSK